MQTKIVLDGRSLTLDAVRAVARGEAQVELSPSSVELLKESRKLVFELSDRGIPLYTAATAVSAGTKTRRLRKNS